MLHISHALRVMPCFKREQTAQQSQLSCSHSGLFKGRLALVSVTGIEGIGSSSSSIDLGLLPSMLLWYPYKKYTNIPETQKIHTRLNLF